MNRPETVNAAPQIQIHDYVDIEMGPVTRQRGQILVEGRLVQRGSGEGVSQAQVVIQVDSGRVTQWTQNDGSFHSYFSLGTGRHVLSVDYRGSTNLDAAHFEVADFEVRKNAISLEVQMAAQVSDTDSEIQATLSANAQASTTGLKIAVLAANGNQLLKQVDTLILDEAGKALLSLPLEALGGPGRKRFEFQFQGNSDFDPATASASLVVAGTSSLSLNVGQTEFRVGEQLRSQGRLLDGKGDPIAGALITVRLSEQRIADKRTDSRGDFRFQMSTEEVSAGVLVLQAKFAPLSSFGAGSISPPVQITVRPREAIPIAFTLGAFGFASLALLSFIGLRTKPWTRLRSSSAPSVALTKPEGIDTPLPKAGFTPKRRKLRSALHRVSHYNLSGQVRDAMSKAPISGATLHVSDQQSQREQMGDEAGAFNLLDLSSGEYQVRVVAAGYVSERFVAQIPHHGEYHDCHITLLPVREKIFALYKEAVRHSLPSTALWGIWTPRQILDHLRSENLGEALSELTDFVEESFFSQRIVPESQIAVAQQLIQRLDKEATAASHQP